MASDDYGDLEKPVLAALQKLGHAAKITDLLKQLQEDEPSTSEMSLMDFTQVVSGLAAKGTIENQRGTVKTRPSGIRSLGGNARASASNPATVRGRATSSTSGPKVVPTSKTPSEKVPVEEFDPSDPETLKKPILSALINFGGTATINDLHPHLQGKSSKSDLRLMEVVTVVDALEKSGLAATSGRGVVRVTTAGRRYVLGEDAELPEEPEDADTQDELPADAPAQDLSKMYHKKIQSEMMNRFGEARTRQRSGGRSSAYRFATRSSAGSEPADIKRPVIIDDGASLEELVKSRERATRDEIETRLPYMSVDRFNALCRKLLEAMGFTELKDTVPPSQSDYRGHGRLKVAGAPNAPDMSVAFRVKVANDKSPVPASLVEKLREEITGERDQGIILTNGTFSDGARSLSVQPGMIPIVLMDGAAVVETMMKHQVGVVTKQVTLMETDPELFPPDTQRG